ncbi:MAG: hypothetical protein CMO82_13130 [Winogradskyella sp.]|nr:hypothetical protein [Winogradskyella sp.]|tara:strand:+ start:151 stop:1197 length:1047 start_codon:yes stop_codon:yes gene_type:complete
MGNNYKTEPSSTRLLIWVGIIGLSGLLTILFTPDREHLPSLLITALGSTLVGSFIGFLFGFPKANKKRNNSNEKSFQLNTNLEEITDWLTKILVGLGISQLPSAKSNITSLINFINEGSNISQSIVLFLLLYFIIYGFFVGYLSSSLYLKSLLDHKYFNAETFIHDVEKELEKYYGTGRAFVDSKLAGLNNKLSFNKLKVLKIIEHLEKKGTQISANAYRNIGIQFFKYHDYDTALELFFKSAEIDENAHALSNISVTYSRHLHQPKLGEKYLKKALKQYPDNALVNYNYACMMLRKNKIDKALEHLGKSIEVNSDEFLYAAQNDSVWKELKDDSRFKDLVPEYDPED